MTTPDQQQQQQQKKYILPTIYMIEQVASGKLKINDIAEWEEAIDRYQKTICLQIATLDDDLQFNANNEKFQYDLIMNTIYVVISEEALHVLRKETEPCEEKTTILVKLAHRLSELLHDNSMQLDTQEENLLHSLITTSPQEDGLLNILEKLIQRMVNYQNQE